MLGHKEKSIYKAKKKLWFAHRILHNMLLVKNTFNLNLIARLIKFLSKWIVTKKSCEL